MVGSSLPGSAWCRGKPARVALLKTVGLDGRARHQARELAHGQQAVTMSGGEQQMLAIARAAASKPKFILLDEPSEGIMPLLVDEMFRYFRTLKQSGVTILLIEQNVELALRIADRAYILDQGEVVYAGTAEAMLADAAIQERYCAV